MSQYIIQEISRIIELEFAIIDAETYTSKWDLHWKDIHIFHAITSIFHAFCSLHVIIFFVRNMNKRVTDNHYF